MSFANQLENHIITPLTDNDCWLTDISPNSRGYCTTQYKGNRVYIHRLAWELFNAEPIPEGLVVMHTCDVPGCCNPNHLRIGTQQENITDREVKGRGNRKSNPRGPDLKPRKKRKLPLPPRKRNANGTYKAG